MSMTITRYTRKSSVSGGNPVCESPNAEGFFKRYTLRGRDPAVADENLYRYCVNDPNNATDPTGLAADQKPRSEASARARELERLLPDWLDMLKKIAKDTKEVERFGVILKTKDPNAKPQYKCCECVSKASQEKFTNRWGQEELRGATRSFHMWWNSDQMHGGLVPNAGPDGRIDLDATQNALDTGYPIEFQWHTHPQDGDPWPSTVDGQTCKNQDILGVMIRYMRRPVAGRIEDDWAIWIVDTDGKTYEYKPATVRAE